MLGHHDYGLCGWRLSSALPLAELVPWRGDNRPPDITIQLGPAPPLAEPTLNGPFLSIDRTGNARFEFKGVASFLMRNGNHITVDPQMPVDAPDIGLFLLGTVFGVLCHQRGELPIHGSCVNIAGRAVIFAGDSGCGKSTLAAALLAQGHRLLADDVTLVRPADRKDWSHAEAIPTFPRQKLWLNSLAALNLSPGRRLRSRADMDKFEFAVGDAFHSEPLPLAMICHLHEARLPNLPPLQRLRGEASLDAIRAVVYRLRAGQQLDRGTRLFASCAALAAGIPQYRLLRPSHFDALPAFAEALPELLGLTACA
jgi:hypothetical protein